MDREELVQRCSQFVDQIIPEYLSPDLPAEALADLLEELTGGKAPEPGGMLSGLGRPYPQYGAREKTRGQEVAEQAINHFAGALTFEAPPLARFLVSCNDLSVLKGVREYVARLIDAEIDRERQAARSTASAIRQRTDTGA